MKEYPDNYECDGQMDLFDYIPDPDVVLDVDVRGICDDAYCPRCNYAFLDSETDMFECPHCGQLVRWDDWHRINDKFS